MELIDFRGLNCYYNSIVTVANVRGIDYAAAFSALWSETDFKYDPFRKVFLTKRLLTELGNSGANLVMLPCGSPAEAEASLARFDDGELAIVGMDAFYIPWNQLYELHHGAHYFIAAVAPTVLTCYDPTYGLSGMSLARRDLTAHVFDVSRLYETPRSKEEKRIENEAAEVLRILPALREKLGRFISFSSPQTRETTILLAKYVDTLMSNRRLFAFYLKTRQGIGDTPFDDHYFKDFQSVKNGVYKCAVTAGEAIKTAIRDRLDDLFARETAYAHKLLGK